MAVFSWTIAASLATAIGTLVLAVATFSAVRSSNRSARIAEAALQEQRRPVLAASRFDDPVQKINFLGGHWVQAAGGRAVVEHIDGLVYLAISMRNVGSGIAVCLGWTVGFGPAAVTAMAHSPIEEFRLQSRDLYVPSGDVGIWQGALRNPGDPRRTGVIEAIETGQPISVEVMYTDLVGRERTISRFGLAPAHDTWIANLSRHWFLDWDGPRPESVTTAANATILQDLEAAIGPEGVAEVRTGVAPETIAARRRENDHADAGPADPPDPGASVLRDQERSG